MDGIIGLGEISFKEVTAKFRLSKVVRKKNEQTHIETEKVHHISDKKDNSNVERKKKRDLSESPRGQVGHKKESSIAYHE